MTVIIHYEQFYGFPVKRVDNVYVDSKDYTDEEIRAIKEKYKEIYGAGKRIAIITNPLLTMAVNHILSKKRDLDELESKLNCCMDKLNSLSAGIDAMKVWLHETPIQEAK